MSLIYARLRLAEWARYNREDSLGYPRSSAVCGGISSGRAHLGMAPLHVQLVDVIVRQMDVGLRRVVIVHYTQTGPGREKAVRLSLTYGTYTRWLKQGQDHVGIELDYAEGPGLDLRGPVLAHSMAM